jgi:hypothetical protein
MRRRLLSVCVLLAWAGVAGAQDVPGPYLIEAVLPMPDTEPGARTVALSDDAAFVSTNAGIATYARLGGTWTAGPVLNLGAFGFGRALDYDGTSLLVGAQSAAYLFRRDSAGVWALRATLTPTTRHPLFGIAVAIDGSRAIVAGPPGPPGSTLWTFVEIGTAWTLESLLPVTGPVLTGPLALSGDRLAVSSGFDGSSRVDVYRWVGGLWLADGVFRDPPHPDPKDPSATSGAIGGDRLVWLGSRLGQAHLLRREVAGWVEEAVYAGDTPDALGSGGLRVSGTRVLLGKHVLEWSILTGWQRIAAFERGPLASATLRGDRLLWAVPATPTTAGTVTIYTSGVSAEGTTVPPAEAIVDTAGTHWTFGVNGETLRDGVHTGSGYGHLYWWGAGALYVLYSDVGWWVWDEPGQTWVWYWPA